MIDKVLIVEDEIDIRFLMKRYFLSKKLKVTEAASFKQAESQISNIDETTLITLDINLPDGNGLDLLKQIRSIEEKCRIVVCSAYADCETKALNLGANAFISKPISMNKLGAFCS